MKELIDKIERKFGVIFDEEKLRIELDMKKLTVDQLLMDEALFDEIVEDILIKETYFFRERSHFEIIRDKIFAEIVEKRNFVKIWSAGCATGEEPYSIVIYLHTKCKDNCKILASDISRKAIEQAKKGVYTRSSLRALSDTEIKFYFEKINGGKYKLKDQFRKVDFFRHNLLDPLPAKYGKIDVIFVRNALMYFSERAKKKAIDYLKAALQDDGYLILGVSEYLIGIENELYPLDFDGVTVFSKTPIEKSLEIKEESFLKIYKSLTPATNGEIMDLPDDLNGLIIKGMKFLKSGAIRNAINYFEKALNLDDKIYFIHYQLAQLYEEIGDQTGFYRECLKINEMLKSRVPLSSIDIQFNLTHSVLRNFVKEAFEGMKWVLS